jgi:hypothetical protein
MGDSFVKRCPRLQASAQLGDLLGAKGPRWKLFKRAEGYPVGLAQGTIDGAGFGHAHLGMVEDKGRNVAGVGIAIAHEAPALGGLENGGFENPEVFSRPAQWQHRLGRDSATMLALS